MPRLPGGPAMMRSAGLPCALVRSTLRHLARRERGGVPAPDPPPVSAPAPHIGDHKGATSILTHHGGLHLRPLENRRAVSINVDDLLLDSVGVDHVVRQRCEPLIPGNHGACGVDQDKRVIVIQHGVCGDNVSPRDAVLELRRPFNEFTRHLAMMSAVSQGVQCGPRVECMPALSGHRPSRLLAPNLDIPPAADSS